MYLTISKKPRKLNRGKSARRNAAIKRKNAKRVARCMNAKPRRRRS